AIDGWLRDFREAFRTLRNSPGFTAAAVLSLALGIGANTAIFSLINALLLRTLPVEDPAELVQVLLDGPTDPIMAGSVWEHFPNPLYEELRDRQQVFSGVFAYAFTRFDLAPKGEVDNTDGLLVSGDFFRTLGVSPLRGRLLGPEDDVRGCGPAGPSAVISERLWETRYGRDEAIVGRTILLNRLPFRVVGVTPRWFTGLDSDRRYSVAIPLGCEPVLHAPDSWLANGGLWWLRVLARLPSDRSFEAARDHLRSLSPGILEATIPDTFAADRRPQFLSSTLALRSVSTGFSSVGARYKRSLYALLGIAALVLLVACANTANLLLARSEQRGRELSMRMALGAGRARLVRRLLCESLLLGAAGSLAGLGLALGVGRALVALLQTQERPIELDLTPDVHVLAFTTAAAVLTALMFGLAPAVRATRIRLNDVLKEGARGTVQGRRRGRFGLVILAGQVALSLILVAGAGLFLETMRNLLREDLGFDPRDVLIVDVNLKNADVVPEARRPRLAQLLERFRSIPGVRAAAESTYPALSGFGWYGAIRPEGYTPTGPDDGNPWLDSVSPGYFETMRSRLVMGRDFGPADMAGSPRVLILDERTARRYWGSENPIGKTVVWDKGGGQERVALEVVGVVAPVKYLSISESPRSTGYLPAAQDKSLGASTHFLVRSNLPGAALSDAIRSAVEELSPGAAISFRSLETQVNETMTQQRLIALLSTAFAVVALLLAAVGLYGVASFGAEGRKGEIGVRIALGARPASVAWLVLRGVLWTSAAGMAAGWAGSLALGGLIEGFLFGVEPGDPRLLGLAALTLAAVGALAAYIPARRASKLQPIAVLRAS
ncbi:MAG: ABC transporter permease, partial [Acidobacteria bacterium]|nr:ABC transporter permease [Acidobacteriota bacterium]